MDTKEKPNFQERLRYHATEKTLTGALPPIPVNIALWQIMGQSPVGVDLKADYNFVNLDHSLAQFINSCRQSPPVDDKNGNFEKLLNRLNSAVTDLKIYYDILNPTVSKELVNYFERWIPGTTKSYTLTLTAYENLFNCIIPAGHPETYFISTIILDIYKKDTGVSVNQTVRQSIKNKNALGRLTDKYDTSRMTNQTNVDELLAFRAWLLVE